MKVELIVSIEDLSEGRYGKIEQKSRPSKQTRSPRTRTYLVVNPPEYDASDCSTAKGPPLRLHLPPLALPLSPLMTPVEVRCAAIKAAPETPIGNTLNARESA